MPAPDDNPTQLSRRTFLRGSTAAAATLAAASLPLPVLALAGRGEGPDNVRVSNDDYPSRVEPYVASNPRDHRNLLGAAMVGPVQNPDLIATYASFDGGRTWRSNRALPLPPATVWADDVTVAFDGQGSGFVCAMATSGQSRNDRGVYVWRTDDGGRSFGAPVPAMTGQFADHPWLAVDRSREEEPGKLYAVWVAADHAALGFGRSTDGGRTFEPPRTIQGPGDQGVSVPMVAAGPGGTVCAVYRVQPPGRPKDVDYQLVEAVCSTDYGKTFGPPVALGLEAAEIFLPGGAQAGSSPAVAIAPHGGAIYAAFVTHESGATHSNVVLATSSDRGQTWSSTQVTPSGQAIYFQPQLVVDEPGRVAVSAFALDQGRVDLVLFVSESQSPRFDDRLVVTSQSFDPTQGTMRGGKHGAWWIGDYQGLASTPGAFHPFWNDTRTGRLELFTASVRAR